MLSAEVWQLKQRPFQSDMTSHSKVVKELQSEVRTLVTALREQTEISHVEQQTQIEESLYEIRVGKVRNFNDLSFW